MATHFLTSRLLHKLGKLRVPHQKFSLSAHLRCEKIVIPNRIHRSPTDVLQALASTVGFDTSGPHYKYHDDPYLTPGSNIDKRVFALSKESGRKAAQWVRDEHSRLFQHQPEEPVIEAYYPKISYTEESNVSEATIEDLIQKSFVTDAIQVYQICQTKGIELSQKIRQELLEFVSFYNCEEALEEEWIEEGWYRQGVVNRGGIRKTWKDNGIAEELFQSLEDKSPKAFCALIRGMAKYFQIDKAWQLYQEACDKGMVLDTETHNAIIRVAPFLRENSELRWQLIKDLLQTMAEKGIQPNLGTLNSTLEALVQAAGWRQTRVISLQVLKEFMSAGVQPSLASYYNLLLIHCRERGPVSSILVNILDHIEGQEFYVEDFKDSFFFVTAMDVCCNHLKSFDLAKRVNKLLLTGENYRLIGDSYKESIYHRHFFTLACSSLTSVDFMEIYHDMVPHIYTPEPKVMAEILSSLKVHDALEYLPQIWSDMIVFAHVYQERLVTEVLSCTASHQPSVDNEKLTGQMNEIAWDIWTRIQNQREDRRNKITWSGPMISNVIITLVKAEEYDKAVEVFRELLNNQHSVLGSASIESLQLLCKAAIENKDNTTAVNIVTYAVDAGHQEAGDLGKEVSSKLDLSPLLRGKLTSSLGMDLMNE